jgi:hypothetical protein
MATHTMILAELLCSILFLRTSSGDYLRHCDGPFHRTYINNLDDDGCSNPATYVFGLKRLKLSLLPSAADVSDLTGQPRRRTEKAEAGKCRKEGRWKRNYIHGISRPQSIRGPYFTQRGPP